jgi:hypothetical protein
VGDAIRSLFGLLTSRALMAVFDKLIDRRYPFFLSSVPLSLAGVFPVYVPPPDYLSFPIISFKL